MMAEAALSFRAVALTRALLFSLPAQNRRIQVEVKALWRGYYQGVQPRPYRTPKRLNMALRETPKKARMVSSLGNRLMPRIVCKARSPRSQSVCAKRLAPVTTASKNAVNV